MTLTVVLPTVNEAHNLPFIIPQIKSYIPSASITIVDDASTDRTPEVATLLDCTLISRPRRLGIASAFRDAALSCSTPYIALMDADGQHPPSLLPSLLTHAAQGYDLVIAQRHSNDPLTLYRRLVSWGSRLLTHLLLPPTRSLTDIGSGYFLTRTDIAQTTRYPHPKSWKVIPDILMSHPTLKVKSIPYPFGSRLSGTSKLNYRVIYHYLVQLLKWRLTV